jgi:adenosylcobinamide amidohydrolase
VHMGRGLADRAPNPNAVVPAPGTVVNTTVDVKDNGDLDEQDENEVGQVNGNIQVQATVTAVGNGTVTLSVNGQSVTVNLPAGLTLPASFVGQTVTINVSLANDNEQGDDNDQQGDDDGGDHGGDGGDG